MRVYKVYHAKVSHYGTHLHWLKEGDRPIMTLFKALVIREA